MQAAVRKRFYTVMEAVEHWNSIRSPGRKKLTRGFVTARCRRGLIKGAVLRQTVIATWWEIPVEAPAPMRMLSGRPRSSR